MSFVSPRRAVASVASAALTIGLVAALPPVADAATTLHAYGGAAYGSVVKVGDVRSGKTSYITVCTTDDDSSKTSNSAGVDFDELGDLSSLGSVGAVTTEIATQHTGSTYSTVATTEAASTTLVDGLITADAITATSTAAQTGDDYDLSGTVSIVNLKVAGVSVPNSADPEPNTKLTLPGIGELILNEQTESTTFGIHALIVNAIRINVTDAGNILGVPTGGYVVVVDANAQIRDSIHLPYGGAYGTQVDLAGVVTSGPTAQVTIPCGGSSGEKKTSNLASITVPGVLDGGLARTSATSTETDSTAVVTTKAIVDDTSLLGDVVTVQTVTAKATATLSKGKVTGSASGSSVAGLQVNGTPVTVTGKDNQVINIAGVGTLTLRATETKSTSFKVTAVQLKLTTAQLGLAKNTVLAIGVAKSGIHI